jgi:putative intracellular protease/amidase
MKVLIIVTSHALLGDSQTKTGLWLEELAVPYRTFVAAGATVDIASIQGGAAPIDPKSEKGESASVRAFLDDSAAMSKVKNTLKLANVSDDYDAVFVAGGHGTMWDLPNHPDVVKVLSGAFKKNRIVAAVCHGPAALIGAMNANGEPLVKGRKFTSFTNEEEEAAGLTKVVPFLLQSKLSELGGRFEGAPKWASHVVRDGNLVTGQNPASSLAVAEAVLVAVKERLAAK